MKKVLERAWASNAGWLILLKPMSWVYALANRVHRFLYESGILKQTSFSVPVIVVGNIFVGGTGKTPTVIALSSQLTAQGKKVGIVSRGYGAYSAHYPLLIKPGDDPSLVGDEPLLMAETTKALVVCDPDRVRGIRYLIEQGCDLILSDDGLQHYRLKPSVRIAVHPATWVGSDRLLPAGPFREPLSRLKTFDDVLMMDDSKRSFYCMDREGHSVDCGSLPQDLQVVVGIAQPTRLLQFLGGLHIRYTAHIFPDHHAFVPTDFEKIQGPILMTTKDWVKCRGFVWKQPVYVIGYAVQLPETWGKFSKKEE